VYIFIESVFRKCYNTRFFNFDSLLIRPAEASPGCPGSLRRAGGEFLFVEMGSEFLVAEEGIGGILFCTLQARFGNVFRRDFVSKPNLIVSFVKFYSFVMREQGCNLKYNRISAFTLPNLNGCYNIN